LVQGALYPAVTDKQVFEQKIPLPPLQEQNRIVEKLSKQLDAADKVLKQCEKELEAINKLPASLLQRAFEGDEK
jgi:type I restriction enzyme S subunit